MSKYGYLEVLICENDPRTGLIDIWFSKYPNYLNDKK